ncbi:uncharacterized protein F4817DRAFT_363080 [Daldinia loculata]|uniref:uncharacterized protein n=1 Tax=Daldinia loculata TaxID=103429 RepID=UPI0020C1F9B1|nr:uncharacterized protein F4817DRAFT_363080 [Daldinia loculata]KAI1652163.1 hypothetical protein F4817DRAFT_363080 [Daldinia loculata]
MASRAKQPKKDDDPPPYSEHRTDGLASPPTATAQTPPPPFTPRQQQQQQQQQPTPLPQIPRQFPPAFNMYIETRRHYHIGEHQSTPLYAVTLSPSFFFSSSRPDVVLHSGPGDQTPPLAVVARTGREHNLTVTVTLPPAPAPGSQAPRRAEERVETPGFLGGGTFSFVVEVGPGLGGRREMFEWRRSRGGAVEALGGRMSGWKLVRMRTDAPSGLGGGGGGGGRGTATFAGGARAGDGREVVAVWAWANMSLTKKLRFRFLGSGASGVLGERWAVMAVATALWIWERERRSREESGR